MSLFVDDEHLAEPATATVGLEFHTGNDQAFIRLGVEGVTNSGSIVTIEVLPGVTAFGAVREHLEANADHYSAAVWNSVSPTTIAPLLAGYELDGKPVLEQVDPTPIAVAGGYLVLRWPLEGDTAETNWKKSVKIDTDKRTVDLVPIPSGGVFAEAVLGRSNSAEKLDLTRFWNWQDSPIPIVAPDIAPVGTGSRAQAEPIQAGQLDQPIVNIVTPTSLPDPTFAATMNVLGQANLFRDMSGLVQAATLAQSAQQASAAGAAHASTQAGQNLATFVDLLKTVAAAALGLPAVSGGRPTSPATISNAGARLNQADHLDQATRGRTQNTGSTWRNNGATNSDEGPYPNKVGPFTRAAMATDLGLQGAPVLARSEVLPEGTERREATLPPLSPEWGGLSIGESALEPGDIIVSTTDAIVSSAIRLGTNSPVSHAILYAGTANVDGGTAHMVVEAIHEGVVERELKASLAESFLAVVFRMPGLNSATRDAIVKAARDQKDKKFSVGLAIRAGALRAFGSSQYYQTVDIGSPSNVYFCSMLVADAYKAGGVNLDAQLRPTELVPGDIPMLPLDYVGHLKWSPRPSTNWYDLDLTLPTPRFL